MANKIISWITADYFIDVDLPIVPQLSSSYVINWFILLGTTNINKDKIVEVCRNTSIKLHFISIKHSWYSPLSFLEYYLLFSKIKKEKPNIVYCDLSSLSYTFLAADLVFEKKNVVFATHNVTTPKGARLELLAKLNMYYLLRRFQNFHVFSKNQHQVLMNQVCTKNILYAPLALKDYGISSLSNIEKSVKQINFLSFGHIRNYKRIDLLIKASQLAYDETKIIFKVTIAGSCSDWEKYQKLIYHPFLFDLNIGYINDSQIPNLFAKAHYLVLPYQDLAQSGAITVAFNYGLPVVTSDIFQFKEFVKEDLNGFLFESESVNDLKRILIKLLYTEDFEYYKLRERTMQYVDENYSSLSICNKYVDYFNNLILNSDE